MTSFDVHCYVCGSKLVEMGALYFSPPRNSKVSVVSVTDKYHLCKRCSIVTEDYFKTLREFTR